MALRRPLIALATVALLLTWAGGEASGSGAAGTPPAPCGTTATAHYSHVVWIMLENVGYSVVGSPGAPYFNELVSECGLATNYYAVSHPSLPNYIALTSGSTQGITDDGEPSEHPLHSASLFSQLGSNWRVLAQSMPVACDRVTSGNYAARHNPAVYYTNITAACRRDDIPLTRPLDVSARFTLIVPNICDDMHSCSETVGDRWLETTVPSILASAQYRSDSLVLFITFDENDSGPTNRVPTLVIAPSTPVGDRVGVRYTHYSLLRTTETLLGLAPLARARTARSMAAPFHL